MQPALHRAAAALCAQLALGYFVPLCLTAVAILARVRVRNWPFHGLLCSALCACMHCMGSGGVHCPCEEA